MWRVLQFWSSLIHFKFKSISIYFIFNSFRSKIKISSAVWPLSELKASVRGLRLFIQLGGNKTPSHPFQIPKKVTLVLFLLLLDLMTLCRGQRSFGCPKSECLFRVSFLFLFSYRCQTTAQELVCKGFRSNNWGFSNKLFILVATEDLYILMRHSSPNFLFSLSNLQGMIPNDLQVLPSHLGISFSGSQVLFVITPLYTPQDGRGCSGKEGSGAVRGLF